MRSAEPFVPTSAVRDAVKGRELEFFRRWEFTGR